MEDGKHSGEEEDKKELLIALDEWIDLIDGLKEKQKAREDRLGRAAEDTETLQQLQENLGHRWANKERSPALIEAGDSLVQPTKDSASLEPLVETPASVSSSSQLSTH